MGGLVLDIWIAFLLRTIANAWKKIAGARWPARSGKITGFRYHCEGLGCDYGEYRYSYFVDGKLHRGSYRTPFFMRRAAEARESASIGAEIQVRVCPNDPSRSILIGF